MCHAYFSFQVLKNCSKDTSDWSLFSELAEKRQRHPLGNIELPFQIITHLKSPNLANYGTPEGFQEFIYLSQITQAEELRTETEVYRRGMGKIDNELGKPWEPSIGSSMISGQERHGHHSTMEVGTAIIFSSRQWNLIKNISD